MTFDPVDPRQSFPDLERGILKYWKEEDLFRRSVTARKGGEPFAFYDGPPFATGLPHYGHLLAGTIKDVIPRYQTMQGKQVQRRFGWDCHGLPIENLIEKEHGIKNKKEIEEMGVAKFNALCRASVQRYTNEWRTVVERTGRWVDMDWDYRTMDADYMESMWWAFKQIHLKDLLYEGHKPMHVCPRCVTPLSNFEVTQGYKEVTDQTAVAKFLMKDSEDSKDAKDSKERSTFFLAWTTTPWTLPGNLFLAVGPKVTYAIVQSGDARYVVAKERAETIFKDKEYEIEEEVKGKDLIGTTYEPLFPYFAEAYAGQAFRVVGGDFVTTEDGTGIVHIAPGFGEDDYEVGKREKVKILQHITMDGHFVEAVTDFFGMEAKPKDDPMKTDRKVTEWLENHGKLFASETYRHTYPHCWRCDSPLLNYATSSWFIRVEQIKEKMLENAKTTEWVPSHLRDGRFSKWLENARDWAISRNRYWGTPLPIWRVGDQLEVIGSRTELMEKNLIRFTKITALRHGESEGNLIPLYQGKEPGTDLTSNGREQASETGRRLKEEQVSVIYCSPLARTRQTAEIIAKQTGAKVIVDERLREVVFGDYEGKTIDFSDLKIVQARRAKKLESSSPESVYHFPGMEEWSSVYARMSSFLDEILPRHRSEHVVVVTHADPIVSMRHYFTKEDPFKLSHQPFPPYATPYVFFWDHDANKEMDLHKEFVDTVTWQGSRSEHSVDVTMVRHGETEFNKDNRIQGGAFDPPLNDTGRAQAEEIAKGLAKETFDVVISSDRKRAVETAESIGKALGVKTIEQWSELGERDAGDWAGEVKDDIYAEFPPYPGCDAVSWHYATPHGGESLSHMLQRAQQTYEKILQFYPGKKVLIVSHRGTLLAFKAIAENRSYAEIAQMKVKNTETFRLQLHPLYKRIPEVLDCWFESGSMPYAQQHYPFEGAISGPSAEFIPSVIEGLGTGKQEAGSQPFPMNFPADFIAEGVDQTRAWFYTLMVLSTALFGISPYKNVVVNGIVLAEDGKKMSKRLKNYPDPMEVVEKHGADALRFALMSSPAVRAEDLRFSAKVVEEMVRGVLLPLWNTYSFLVTYGNAADFNPSTRPQESPHPLDRFIRLEIQDLTNRMTEQLERYDLSATCAELHETIDALTNWYVRLSRRRFAGKGDIDAPEAEIEDHDGDRQYAISTLYDVLVTLTQLLAPFCPFVTEAIYLNLVGEPHGSIHLTTWPATRKLTKEEHTILEKNRMLRQIVSLGMTVRSEQKAKVRQPLQKATIAIPPALLKEITLDEDDRLLLRRELNVKDITFAEDPGTLGEAIAMVDARKVGPRLGKRVQEVIVAGKRGDFTVQPDGSVLILEESFAPDEVSIIYRGREGENIAAHKGIVVSLDTRITEELKLEGQARDLIRSIQKLRKEAELEMTDRIALQIEGADPILQTFGELIAQETNATLGENAGEAREADIDGLSVTLRFEKR